MKKDDIYGIGASLLLHLLLLVAFGVINLAATEPEPLGYIEVDFGPISEGRPIQRAVETRPATEAKPEPKQEKEVQKEAAPPKEAKPVELPDRPQEIVDEEEIKETKAETISPVEQNKPAKVVEPEPKPEVKPTVEPQPLGGSTEGGASGNTEGTPGSGEDEQKTAPFQIEGLNRSPIYTPRPDFPEKVNAEIKVRITVNPQGSVVQLFPVQKGNPSLERAVRDALSRWRFNALPSNAPQVNQTGIVTVRFRVE